MLGIVGWTMIGLGLYVFAVLWIIALCAANGRDNEHA